MMSWLIMNKHHSQSSSSFKYWCTEQPTIYASDSKVVVSSASLDKSGSSERKGVKSMLSDDIRQVKDSENFVMKFDNDGC